MSGREMDYIKEAFDTNWVVPMGPNVNGFEKDLAEYVNRRKDGQAPLHKSVVGLSAGTAAVHLALIAMELQRMIPKATPKMLSQQLHDLEECGMIHREVIPDKPPRTIYSLTPFGRSIIPVLDAMCNWGTNFLDGLDIQPLCCTKKSAVKT